MSINSQLWPLLILNVLISQQRNITEGNPLTLSSKRAGSLCKPTMWNLNAFNDFQHQL